MVTERGDVWRAAQPEHYALVGHIRENALERALALRKAAAESAWAPGLDVGRDRAHVSVKMYSVGFGAPLEYSLAEGDDTLTRRHGPAIDALLTWFGAVVRDVFRAEHEKPDSAR